MADAGTFCTDAMILKRCGTNASADVKAAAWFDTLMPDIDAQICCVTRYNWIDAYAALNVDVKHILSDTAACLAAIQGIIYDMSGYTSRVEAEDMINVLRDIALRHMSLLRDKKLQDFMVNA